MVASDILVDKVRFYYNGVTGTVNVHTSGVEKNNDDAKHHVFSSNGHDAPKNILVAEAIQEELQREEPSVIRKKRQYIKRKLEYWEKGIVEQRQSKRPRHQVDEPV